jgi:hypothetical protein
VDFRIKHLVLAVATACGLAACGGGGGGGTANAATPAVLSGTAAVGTPIVGATVSVRCANGLTATSSPTGSMGQWQVSLTDQVFPCAVQLNGGTINSVANTTQLHSIALTSGTINVTPLTDLMVAFASHAAVPSAWFASLQSSGLTSVDANSLHAALSLLINVLQMGQLSDIVNPMTSSFAPIAGNVIDDTLTALAAAMTSTSTSYGTLLSQVSGQNPVVPNALTTAILSQYATTHSGSGVTSGLYTPPTGTNTTTGQAANGSPRVNLANCGVNAGSGAYAKCQANAIANFGPVTVHDAATSATCTANYVDGILSVSNGTLSLTGYMNASFLSDLNVWGTGSGVTVDTVSGYSSNGSSVDLATVSWGADGVLQSIHGKVTQLTTGTSTEFTCTN